MTEVRQIHEELLKLVWEVNPPEQLLPGERAGSFRKHDIKRFSAGMKPPAFTEVHPLMRDFVNNANKSCSKIAGGSLAPETIPLELAKIHNRFEQIHPFRDGNGRTGRLVLNLLLVRLGYPPCIILKARRAQYLRGLQAADNGNYNKLGEMIARGVLDNVHRFIIPATLNGNQLVPLESLVSKDLSYAALRQAAYRGKLAAKLGANGRYFSTKKAVNDYLISRYRR